MKNILILCTGNSCRSQMAEGYIRYFLGTKANIYSAGIEAHGINPLARFVMQEDGIDISHQTSNTIDEYKHIIFDFVITVCDNAREKCPYFSVTTKQIHRSFSDPAKAIGTDNEIKDAFRKVRNLIKQFCETFVKEYFLEK